MHIQIRQFWKKRKGQSKAEVREFEIDICAYTFVRII
jgi:hypothetical protein